MEEISLTPSQVEFLAEDTIIKVVPNFKMETLIFLSGEYGPFVPSFPISIPLWLAISLKKKKKCTIIPPEWMTYSELEIKYQEENKIMDGFINLPDNFIEISTLLLANCPDDISDVNKIRSLIEDILNRRQDKLNTSLMGYLKSLKPNENITMEFNNFSMMEINRVRSSFVSGVNHIYKIQNTQSSTSTSSQTSQSQSSSQKSNKNSLYNK